jgi:hypothetical protein
MTVFIVVVILEDKLKSLSKFYLNPVGFEV